MPHKGLIKRIKKVTKRATALHRRGLKKALKAATKIIKTKVKFSPGRRALRKSSKKKAIASSRVRRPRRRPGRQ